MEEFLELASLRDQQLDSASVAEGIKQRWGMREWAGLGGTSLEGRLQRQHARCLATLPAEQRRRARYLPAGWYAALAPPESVRERPGNGAMIFAGGRTADEARAAARRLYPGSEPPEVRRLRDG